MASHCLRISWAAALLAAGLFAAAPRRPAPTRLTGVVSDSMCGAHHDMGGDPAQCTRKCVKAGAPYVLVVGAQVYTLATTNKRALSELNRLAGKDASVTGALAGLTLNVKAVAPAR
jgi:hypothetical protein